MKHKIEKIDEAVKHSDFVSADGMIKRLIKAERQALLSELRSKVEGLEWLDLSVDENELISRNDVLSIINNLSKEDL